MVKSAAPSHFSFSAFALTEVLVDVESVYNLYTGSWPIHGLLHTLPGSMAVGIVAGALTAAFRRPGKVVLD